MLISYADIRTAADHSDGTFLVTETGEILPYYPAPEFGTHRGYAVALKPLFENDDEPVSLAGGELVGTWWDEERGTFHIDRVVQVKGSITDALAIAKAFDQKAIYDFQSGYVMTVEGKVLVD